MKKDIHPEFIEKAKISCACGAKYEVGSTESEISVELCANCHPFYTGKQKIIDTARRVEKFQARASKISEKPTGKKAKSAKRATTKAKKESSDEK
ncbi:50S ribosomal protein L31 [Patescibacteria group bacterium]